MGKELSFRVRSCQSQPLHSGLLSLCDSDGDVSDLFWSSWLTYLRLDLCCFKIGKDCRSRYGTVRCRIRAATSDPVLFQSLSSSISRGFLSIEYSSHRTWRKLASSPSLHSLVAPPTGTERHTEEARPAILYNTWISTTEFGSLLLHT
jgi:hypothetical protein